MYILTQCLLPVAVPSIEETIIIDWTVKSRDLVQFIVNVVPSGTHPSRGGHVMRVPTRWNITSPWHENMHISLIDKQDYKCKVTRHFQAAMHIHVCIKQVS